MAEVNTVIADLKTYMAETLDPWCTRRDGYVYHYTNPEGIRGILESAELRSRNVLSMKKDPDEIRCSVKAVQPVVDLLWRQLPWSVTRFFRPAGLMGLDTGDYYAYVACFASESDSLCHWRRFAEKGRGAAIGFGIREFAGCANRFALYEVQYDAGLLTATVEAAFKFFLGYPGIAGLSYDEQKAIHVALCEVVLDVLLRFKGAGFGDESEWRALALRPEELSEGYVSFPLRRGAVSQIVLGPHCRTTEAEIRDLLNAGGLDGVPVCRSKFTARGLQ